MNFSTFCGFTEISIQNACQYNVFPFLFISTLSFIVHVFLPATHIVSLYLPSVQKF